MIKDKGEREASLAATQPQRIHRSPASSPLPTYVFTHRNRTEKHDLRALEISFWARGVAPTRLAHVAVLPMLRPGPEITSRGGSSNTTHSPKTGRSGIYPTFFYSNDWFRSARKPKGNRPVPALRIYTASLYLHLPLFPSALWND